MRVIRKFDYWGQGTGKYFKVVTKVQETTEETIGSVVIPDPVFKFDNQMQFQEIVNEVIKTEEPYSHFDLQYFNFECPMYDVSKKLHRRVKKTTSVHEITREEYLERQSPLRLCRWEVNTQ